MRLRRISIVDPPLGTATEGEFNGSLRFLGLR
jgi:hypothetical protein